MLRAGICCAALVVLCVSLPGLDAHAPESLHARLADDVPATVRLELALVVREVDRRFAELRRQRCTGKQIAKQAGVSPATVSRVLAGLGLNKLSALEPAAPIVRYEREQPGEMIHLDIKKLGRFDRVGHRITGDRTG